MPLELLRPGDLGEPANYRAALLDPESKKWLDAMNVEMQSMKDNDVWVLVELPPNARTIGSKWLFKKKTDMDGAVYVFKARLVAKGFTQTYGVDYEETFSPIADIRAIRILIAIAAYYDYKIWQMDVKTTFLNGHLSEEVYMEQPEGFVDPKYPDHVCKLKRSIYGLKQASRQWNKRFDDEIKKFGFTQNPDEPCVYQKASGSYVAILILYVDDILLMGNNIPMLQDVKSYLGRSFAMKDLGDAAYILGIKIYRDRSKRLIGLCQSAYIEKILKRYYMENSKRGTIPMQEKLKLSKSQGASTPAEKQRMQNVPYASAIGLIIYAVRCTRPDVAFAQNITSQFQQNPGNLERELRVSCYTDAGYLTDADDLRSLTGYVFVLNGDAEYITAFDASKEAVWIRKFIFGLGIVPIIEEPISMYCDNTGAIAISKDDEVTKGARHFRAKVHYLRETIKLGDIKIEKVDTDDNLADPFIKALAFPKTVSQHVVIDINLQVVGGKKRFTDLAVNQMNKTYIHTKTIRWARSACNTGMPVILKKLFLRKYLGFPVRYLKDEKGRRKEGKVLRPGDDHQFIAYRLDPVLSPENVDFGEIEIGRVETLTLEWKEENYGEIWKLKRSSLILKVSEHSNGGDYPTSKMNEFQDCVNKIEVDDLHSEGFNYTWTKSLKNPKCSTLKKLDRIMVNDDFVDKFQQAHVMFLPYMIFDHSPIVVKMLNGIQKRKGSFRFSNFITDKKRFLTISIRMVRPISDAEIKNAIFEIEDSKAPGPSGYTAKVNATLISLVPKIPIPEKVSDFRPIACCNVLTIKGYNRKHNIKKVSFKIDLQKAYDTITWGFIKDALDIYGFHKTMVNWTMTCVTSTKFSINVNGERVGYFKRGRGLRQWDPISPYLFTLVMEVLNLLIKKNIKESRVFKYHFGCKNLKITHLCFADDLLVFYHGDTESVKVIKKSLEEFSGFSGLVPNLQKSAIFYGGLTSAEQQNILDIIPFFIGKLPVRYLGVPFIIKKLSTSDCKPLISKVKAKINDWKNKSLSFAGRVQLIASVLSSMQNYWASVFLLPKQVIYEINKILKGFLWCQGELTKGKAKVSWDAVCKPKDQGELGLKNSGIWNEVLMIKHLWNVAIKKDTLWNILRLREKVRKHIWWKHGNENSVNVWHDRWCSSTEFADLDQVQVPTLVDEIEDNEVWRSRNRNEKDFKISTVWKDMNCNEIKVDWHPLRNKRIFMNEKRDKETIFNLVKEIVVMELLGLKVKESRTVNEVEKRWKIKMQRG
ncbi:retrotransposon protein, putative, ty1-copia subclass [Tanacetum coccineum]